MARRRHRHRHCASGRGGRSGGGGRAGSSSSSSTSSVDELQFMEDSSRLEACVAQLQDIVGGSATRTQLEQVAMAADYDVNRALNYLYSS